MPYFAKKDGEIVFHAEGSEPSDEALKQIDPPGKKNREKLQKRYDRDGEKFYTPDVDNRSVYQKILDKFVEWEADQSSALDRADEILSESPTLKIAVREGDTEVVENRLNSISNQVLDQSEKQELIDLIT